MNHYVVTCKYCNNTWKTYYVRQDTKFQCSSCGDTDVTLHKSYDVYGYDSNDPKPDAYIKRAKE